MTEKNRHSMTTPSLDPFNRKFEYRLLFSSAVVCMSVGVVVATVLGASPLAVSVVKYMAPACAVLGAAAGFACGMFVGPLLGGKWRTVLPLIGAGAGAVIQAGWANPVAAASMAAWGGVIGAISGPLFLAMCATLGYFVLRRTRTRSR